jgi:hypothetical protein
MVNPGTVRAERPQIARILVGQRSLKGFERYLMVNKFKQEVGQPMTVLVRPERSFHVIGFISIIECDRFIFLTRTSYTALNY